MTALQSLRPLARFLLVLITTTVALGSHAHAQDLGTNGDWQAIQERENNNPVCVMSSQPTKDEGDYTRRGTILVMVSHRPAEKRFFEVAFQSGYTYQSGSEATATVDGKHTFTLFSDGGYAWTQGPDDDKALVNAMRAGNTLVVKGTSSRGTLTTDTYSLTGFSATLAAINAACNVK